MPAEKITKRAVIQRIDYINMMLEERQSPSRLALDNAYRMLYLVEVDADGTLNRTLKANMSKRELYEHLYMMEQMLWMIPRG